MSIELKSATPSANKGKLLTPLEAYKNIQALLEMLSADPHRRAYLAFHEKFKDVFLDMPASVKGHHSWPGGYAVHIHEVMFNARMIALVIPQAPRHAFALDDLLMAAYIHDLDKLLYRYEANHVAPTKAQIKKAVELGILVDANETKDTISCKIDAAYNNIEIDASRLPRHERYRAGLDFDDSGIVAYFCNQHGLPINLEILHAVCLHHGGWAHLARGNDRAELSGMAAVLHAADLLSTKAQNGDILWTQ